MYAVVIALIYAGFYNLQILLVSINNLHTSPHTWYVRFTHKTKFKAYWLLMVSELVQWKSTKPFMTIKPYDEMSWHRFGCRVKEYVWNWQNGTKCVAYISGAMCIMDLTVEFIVNA